jgi:hypothetical protein
MKAEGIQTGGGQSNHPAAPSGPNGRFSRRQQQRPVTEGGADVEETNRSDASLPYEGVFTKALDKLTSEVLIFLLAYATLIVVLAVFAPSIPKSLQTLLYVIPVLGIAGYGWLRRRAIARRSQRGGVRVKSVVARDGYVGGVRGMERGQPPPSDVRVTAGLTESSHVVGVDYGGGEAGGGVSEGFLLELFRQLSEVDRRRLIAAAGRMVDKP